MILFIPPISHCIWYVYIHTGSDRPIFQAFPSPGTIVHIQYLLPSPVLTLLFIGPFRETPPPAAFFIVYMNRMLPMHLFYHAFQKDQPMCLCSSCYENDGFHSSSCSYL